MEPLTKIELGSKKWLGVLAVACTVAGELLSLAGNPEGQRASFVARETIRRTARQMRSR
jgi:hypothetical protein